MTDDGLRLSRDRAAPEPATLAEVNQALAAYGARIWPLDLSSVGTDHRRLLGAPTLRDDEAASLRARFLLPRAQLLEHIAGAGREPAVPEGGALDTLDETHDVPYPELYVVEPGADYRRFDRLHVNRAADGTGVDETLQMLSGQRVRMVLSLPDVGRVTIHLDCPSTDRGWLASYAGWRPHIASFTGASDGTKVLMQIIGPPVWTMDYLDDER